jgi:hypothetical protein
MPFAWLKYFTFHSVPVLASNSEQHILSPAELQKYVIHCLNFMSNLFTSMYSGGGGREAHETF